MDIQKNFIIDRKIDKFIIIPKNQIYKICIIFFSGGGEGPKKYIPLFKTFLEKENFFNVKIILPFPSKYQYKDILPADFKFSDPKKSNTSINAWYQLHMNHELKTQAITFNKEKDNEIISLINYESNFLGGGENIILAGFSMGGRYCLHLCTLLNLKFHSVILYKCGYTLGLLKNENEKDKLRIQKLYYLFSLQDEVIPFDNSLKSIYNLKQLNPYIFKIQIDSLRNHSIISGGKALQILQEVIIEHKSYINVSENKFKIKGQEKF
jgi:hypothetical protein